LFEFIADIELEYAEVIQFSFFEISKPNHLVEFQSIILFHQLVNREDLSILRVNQAQTVFIVIVISEDEILSFQIANVQISKLLELIIYSKSST
jgi:hypothetical protein